MGTLSYLILIGWILAFIVVLLLLFNARQLNDIEDTLYNEELKRLKEKYD